VLVASVFLLFAASCASTSNAKLTANV